MNRLRSPKDMLDERLSSETMKHLRHLGLHSGALSGGQNDDVELRGDRHLSLDQFFGSLYHGIHIPGAPTRALRD